ncbi:MAG TPA: SAM-dependent methyltransferase [Micromonosporaceae bacterium]
MERPAWAEGVDIDRPSASRVYDYLLGGSHNFAVDRAVAEQALSHMPQVATIARENRAFLRRAVRFLVAQGMRQFLDIGSGITTVGTVHEVAQADAPDTRVCYVDVDPIAVAHSQAILADNPQALIIDGDLREPGEILANPELRGLLDLSRPVGVLLVAVLHFIADADRPADLVRQVTAPLASGSYVVVTHASWPTGDIPDDVAAAQSSYRRTGTPLVLRSRDEILGMLGDLEVVEPGIVPLAAWRPEGGESTETLPGLAVVARKR